MGHAPRPVVETDRDRPLRRRGDLRHGVARGHPRGPGSRSGGVLREQGRSGPRRAARRAGNRRFGLSHTTSRTTGRTSSSGPSRSRRGARRRAPGRRPADSCRACRTPSSRTGTAPARCRASIRRGRRRSRGQPSAPRALPQRLHLHPAPATPRQGGPGAAGHRRRRAEFPLEPFLGTMGVALDTDRVHELRTTVGCRRQPGHQRPAGRLDAVPAGHGAGGEVLRRRSSLRARRRRGRADRGGGIAAGDAPPDADQARERPHPGQAPEAHQSLRRDPDPLDPRRARRGPRRGHEEGRPGGDRLPARRVRDAEAPSRWPT